MSLLSLIGRPKKEDLSECTLRSVVLLLEALAVNALGADAAAKLLFQQTIRSLSSQLEQTTTSSERMFTMGQVIQTIQTCSLNCEQYAQAHRQEIKGVVDCLAATLANVGKLSGQTTQNLQEIERRLVAAAQLTDIRDLRWELKQAAALIEEESARHAREYELLKKSANSAETVNAPAANTTRQVDEVTGFPSIQEAQIEIDAITPGGHVYPAVFFLEHLNIINSRHGYRAGDQVLIQFSQLLALYMKPEDKLFRWRGPSFVALLSRNMPEESVRAELKRFTSQKMEHILDVDQRKVMMKISSVCALIPATTNNEMGGVIERIDSFVAEQSARSAG